MCVYKKSTEIVNINFDKLQVSTVRDRKISIIIPVYNAEKYIQETIESVLNQTYDNFELIAVNDNSTDRSVQIIKSLMDNDERIVLIDNEKPSSAARARNTGIMAATGDVIAFLDADDIWHKEKLEKTFDFMIEKSSPFVFTGYEFADEEGKGLGKVVRVPEYLNYDKALSRTIIFTSTVMFDLKRLLREDILMPEIKSEDTATWWRILRKGVIANGLDENLVYYRRVGRSLSSNKIEAVRRIWNLYRKAEKLSLVKSLVCFVGWGFGAVVRRI